MNVIKRIQKANRGRDPERLAMKYQALRNSPFSFFRGTCSLFHDRLQQRGLESEAPFVWCCGDLHLENFGSYKGENKLVYFDINDFDEAALAPVNWELVRFVSSVHVAARDYGTRKEEADIPVQHFLQAYCTAILYGKARWVERETANGIVRQLLDTLRMRRRVDFLNSFTKLIRHGRRFLPNGHKTLPVADSEREAIASFMTQFAQEQPDPSFYRVIDVARRIAGTGSLGLARYAILVEGRGSPDHNYLIDLKQAMPSALAARFSKRQPHCSGEAHRIVAAQDRMQAVTTANLHAVVFNGAPFVMRALQSVEDRLPMEHFRRHDDLFNNAMYMMGQCVAWAHLRSAGRQGSDSIDQLIEFVQKKRWLYELKDAALTLANQSLSDWKTYCEAFDDKALVTVGVKG